MKARDEKIILAIKEGRDDGALESLYSDTLPKIKRYILRNSGTDEEAKDIFQEAVLVFYRHVLNGKFNEKNDIDGFVFIVAKNLWINQALSNKKNISIDSISSLTEFDNKYAQIVSEEKKEVLKELLNKVGESCKKLLQYSIYHKLPMKEIATIMDFANENVAKATNYRCKQKLADMVRGDETIYSLLRG